MYQVIYIYIYVCVFIWVYNIYTISRVAKLRLASHMLIHFKLDYQGAWPPLYYIYMFVNCAVEHQSTLQVISICYSYTINMILHIYIKTSVIICNYTANTATCNVILFKRMTQHNWIEWINKKREKKLKTKKKRTIIFKIIQPITRPINSQAINQTHYSSHLNESQCCQLIYICWPVVNESNDAIPHNSAT